MQPYTYFQGLDTIDPREPLEDDEMRITFMGSGFPPPDKAQAEMSLFVEVGPWVVPDPVNNPHFGRATDSFIFDCGAGVATNYTSWNGLSMIYSSDTKPETNSVRQGSGVDVFIHEMILPADALTMRTMGITSPDQVPSEVWEAALGMTKTVQNSSHTPVGAYAYLLSQLKPTPRLAVATHFTICDDTVDLAMGIIHDHLPGMKRDQSGKILDGGKHPSHGSGTITWSDDLMVLRVFKDKILVQRAVVKDYLYQPYPGAQWPNQNPPKYDDGDPSTPYGDAYAQLDMSTSIPPTGPHGHVNYREDGY